MKILAALCMLIDHIGYVFFPDQFLWRMIGRLAMPIFAYSLGRGLVYTHSLKQYIRRLSIFALISQLPFWMMISAADSWEWLNLNIGFTFLIAASIVYLYDKIRIEEKQEKRVLYRALIIGGILLTELLHMDYGSYGVLVVLGCYWLIKNKKPFILLPMLYVVWTVLCFGSQPIGAILQSIGVVSFIFIYFLQNYSERKLGKFFYIFYPAHMTLLFMVSLLR